MSDRIPPASAGCDVPDDHTVRFRAGKLEHARPARADVDRDAGSNRSEVKTCMLSSYNRPGQGHLLSGEQPPHERDGFTNGGDRRFAPHTERPVIGSARPDAENSSAT